MAGRDGHIELDRPIDSIRVGYRWRRDLGDLEELTASVRELGLLQPITVSPDGTLICGARRLEVARRMGMKRVNVWVRAGISTRLQQALAEQHENVMRKPFSPTEAAAMYRELKALMAEDAAQRQRAHQFGTPERIPRSDGAAIVAAPSGDTRALAAQAITGRKSYTTLERVSELERIAADADQPEAVRRCATEEIAAMDADGNVAGHYAAVKTAQTTARLRMLAADPTQPARIRDQASRDLESLQTRHADGRSAELARLAEEALARVRAAAMPPAARRSRSVSPSSSRPRQHGVRAFVLTWTQMSGWAEHYDPCVIGPGLTKQQWADFTATCAATAAFADQARAARREGGFPVTSPDGASGVGGVQS